MGPILAIGGTGTVGREVVARLSSMGKRVRVMTRKPSGARAAGGVEEVTGDLSDPESVEPCLRNVDAVFLVWTAPPATVGPVLERIANAARRIVFLSAPLKTAHPLFQQPNGLRALAENIERTIETSGLDWTFLRPGMFAANALSWWAPQIRGGDTVRWPYLEVPTAPLDERDIAAVAVRALTEDGHDGAEYVLTGPESLTQAEQVATIGRALGRQLRTQNLSPDEARRELPTVIPAPAIEMLLAAWGAAAGQPAHVTSTVAAVTGRPARTFLTWASDHATAFRT